MTSAAEGIDTVENYLERIRLAWDAGDASAYAREFAEDATYVIFLGEALLGRGEIERNHRLVFQRWQKGTRMVIQPIGVRQVSDHAVTVLTVGGMGTGPRVRFDKLQTYALVRHGERWICQAFQNTEMSRAARRAYNADRPGVLSALRRLFESEDR